MESKRFLISQGRELQYYLFGHGSKTIVMLHAQGTSSVSYFEAAEYLAKSSKVILIDYYGHGGSTHNADLYKLDVIGDDVYNLINSLTNQKIQLVGHSSGGLIAAYIESNYHCCERLISEDPPFFASYGDRRFNTFNYVDLSTICHDFLNQDEEKDFVLYYFEHQYAWNFFPEKSRAKMRDKLTSNARKYREKHPDKSLKVMFWPKAALEAFRGMNDYDPEFGEAFYTDSFHEHIDYDSILKNIACPTVFLKAKTEFGRDGIQNCALTDDDVDRIGSLVPDFSVIRFDCGHGIHIEKKREFLKVFE